MMRQSKWFKFAWKNVWRNHRRSLTTMGITAVGVAGLLFFGGFALYTYHSLEEFSARQQGHVLLAHRHYFDQREQTPMALGLDGWQAIRKTLKVDPGVRRVLPRIQFNGLISNGDKSDIYLGEGVDAHYEFTVSGPFLQVSKGDVLAPEHDGLPQVMLGKGLAEDLNAKPGDVLTLMSTTEQGALNGLDVQVVGVFGTGVPELDARKLIVDLNTAQSLLNTRRVSTLSVYLKHTADTLSYQHSLNKRYPHLATRNWEQLAVFYHKVRNLYDRIFSVMGGVIIIVVLLSVANTMSMAVMERTREIGTLAAMGTLPWEMMRNFLLEAGLIGILGSLLGMLLAGAMTVYLLLHQVMMPAPPGMTEGYPLAIAFSTSLYVEVGLLMVVVIVLGAFVAVRKGVKKPIVEALAHV